MKKVMLIGAVLVIAFILATPAVAGDKYYICHWTNANPGDYAVIGNLNVVSKNA